MKSVHRASLFYQMSEELEKKDVAFVMNLVVLISDKIRR